MSEQPPHALIRHRRGGNCGRNTRVNSNTEGHKFRGGWSSSIMAVLDDPRRRSNVCALTCCGVLLSDRTRYLVSAGQERPNWKLRRRLNFYLPAGLFLVLQLLTALAHFAAEEESEDLLAAARLLRWILIGVIGYLLKRAACIRAELRKQVWQQMMMMTTIQQQQQQQSQNNLDSSEEEQEPAALVDSAAATNARTAAAVTTTTTTTTTPQFDNDNYAFISQINDAVGCCRCYKKDDDINYEEEPVQEFNLEGRQGHRMDDDDNDGDELVYRVDEEHYYHYPGTAGIQKDLSTCLFRGYANACCGTCCGNWWQCFGMCAIAQEDREIQRLLWLQQQHQDGGDIPSAVENESRGWPPPQHSSSFFQLVEALEMDYITFQKYSEYYPAIQQLQEEQESSLWIHWTRGTSQLSQQIVKYFLYLLILRGILFGIQGQFLSQFVILLGVFAQALLLLYLVHWMWHRHTLSLDAVIKLVASGAVLGFSTGLVVESIMMIAFSFVELIIFFSEAEQEGVSPSNILNNPVDIQDVIKHHLGVYATFLFLTAFVIAALTEELCKYFSYWMVETPDQNPRFNNNNNSKQRQAAQITIAMVAAAVGFATKENLSYIMHQQKTRNEWIVLLLRSLMPIHPICAAIQSIGIVRRDVEGDVQYQLGRSILPAIVLHGTYDFVLFLQALLAFTHEDPQELEEQTQQDDDDNALSSSGAMDDDLMASELIIPLFIGLVFVLGGLTYYYHEAWMQRQRLQTEEDASEAEVQLQVM